MDVFDQRDRDAVNWCAVCDEIDLLIEQVGEALVSVDDADLPALARGIAEIAIERVK